MRKTLITLAAVLAAALTGPVYASSGADRSTFKRPDTIPFPEGSPYSLHIATLGKMLYYDPRLSGAQNMNCVTCHNPSFGYEAPVARAIGAANTPLGRHAPTVLNLAWTDEFFWDGRAPTLAKQAEGPITAAVEMNGHFGQITDRLSEVDEYRQWFKRLFPETGITRENILRAIATYERTIVSARAPFDKWVDGDETAISEEAKRGFELFVGKAGCVACHSGWNMTDNRFHDIGLPSDDIGRGALEPDNPQAQHAFKTPGLRDLTHRAPYMHDGSIRTLEDVIIHYEGLWENRPSISPQMIRFRLKKDERRDLVAFLQSLTAEKSLTPVPLLPN
ncbi:cytochrome-c peroxidase [Coralliovum pocilloporae]|uniref:cytochrome-c peroxidase n=1 Tax=Coralliovum pocilloporae TaxID=3066369 RepID=UPI003306C163